MNETGIMITAALSPKMARSEEGEVNLTKDTAFLWGDPDWRAAMFDDPGTTGFLQSSMRALW